MLATLTNETTTGEIRDRSLDALQRRVACFERAMSHTLDSVNPWPGSGTCWALVYDDVRSGLDGLDGVSVLGDILVGAMKEVLVQAMGFVSITIKLNNIKLNNLTTSKLMEVSCVLRMALLLVDEGSMTEELPDRPCALCRAFASSLLKMFTDLCGFVDALLVATTSDGNLAKVVKMLVLDLMLVLGWVVEDGDFAAQGLIQVKYKKSLIDVVLRLLNNPSMALAAHSSSILEVLRCNFDAKHFVLLRKYLESPAQHGEAAQELRDSIVDILEATK